VHHPLYAGDMDPNSTATRDILEKVDVLVVVGAMFFMQAVPTPEPLCPSCTKVIQIDDNPWQIAKNFPIACGIEGDIKVALAELNEALEAELPAAARAAAAARTTVITAERRTMVETFQRKVVAEWDDSPISGTRFMAELRDAIKPGTHIVDDCWSYSALLRRMLPLEESRQYQRCRTGGAIGGGLPTALGAKLGLPDRPVVCVAGDGSAMWSIQSLWNAAHYDLPVKFFVISNRAFRQVRMMKTRIIGPQAKGRNLGTVLSPPDIDFCSIANGMGVAARKVTQPGELKSAFAEAIDSAVPYLVDVVVDASF
jgi:benzoylformate decarboxylase